MIDSITGVVLAGGKSTRMGLNKAQMPYRDRALIEFPIETLGRVFSRVILSVHRQEDYSELALSRIQDRYDETGPLGGITSVLETGIARIFCVACDMPFLNTDLIEYLCGITDCDAVLPVWENRPETLHAVYSQTLLPLFQQALKSGNYRLTDALSGAHVRYIQKDTIVRLDPRGDSFRNVNTPFDFQEL